MSRGRLVTPAPGPREEWQPGRDGAWEEEAMVAPVIIVTGVSPGIGRAVTLGRIGRPLDIAPAVAFLVSAESAYITGETLYISGGMR